VYWAVEGESFNTKAIWNRLRVMASEDVGIADPCAPFVVDVLEKQYWEFKEKPKEDSHRLFLVNAVLLLAKAPKSRLVDDILITVYGNIKNKKQLEIPDYALDMHTMRGKRMGRGYEHFFAEGAKLENQAIDDPYEEKAKEILLKKKKT
jgi:replication-associated recombination protein RarA